jgi:hypothetical protein
MKIFFLTFYILLFTPLLFSQIQWQKTLGGNFLDSNNLSAFWGEDEIRKINTTNDDGYILVGTTQSNNNDVTGNHGEKDLWVVKMDNFGTVQWKRCYGGSFNDGGEDILQTTDGGYAVCGWTNSNNGDIVGFHGVPGQGNADFFILKINNSGNIIWTKTFGGSNDEKPSSIKQCNDGSFIIVGYRKSNDGDLLNSQGSGTAWALKTDSFGNIEWSKSFGASSENSFNDNFSDVEISNDGTYYFAGSSSSFYGQGNHGAKDFWVVRTDSLGSLLWQKLYGGSANDICNDIQITNDLSIVLVGQNFSFNGDITSTNNIDINKSDLCIFKTDSSGNILWQKSFGGTLNECGYEMKQTFDGGYVIVGFTNSFSGDVDYNFGSEDFWLLKINDAGNMEWETTFGGISNDKAHSIVQTLDGGFVIAGSIFSDNYNSTIDNYYGDGDGWVVKLFSSSGLHGDVFKIFNVFPNPTSDLLTVKVEETFLIQHYVISDQYGKLINQGEISSQSSQIDIHSLESGLYFIRIPSLNSNSIKFVKN